MNLFGRDDTFKPFSNEIDLSGDISNYLNFIFKRLDIIESALHTITGSSVSTSRSDPENAARSILLNPFSIRDQFILGKVIQVVPEYNWYLVSCTNGVGVIPCLPLVDTSYSLAGPRSINTYQPFTTVLVLKPDLSYIGFIIGAIPPILLEKVNNFLMLSDNAKIPTNADPLYVLYLKQSGNLFRAGLLKPRDSTSFTAGMSTNTGIAFSINDFMAQLKVNDSCGLFIYLLDHLCRLSGINLENRSLGYEFANYNDEGEIHNFQKNSLYPWEAVGLLRPDFSNSSNVFKTNEYQDVEQYLYPSIREFNDKNIKPIYRYQKYVGYIGDILLESVSIPVDNADDVYRSVNPDDLSSSPDDPRNVKDVAVYKHHVSSSGACTFLTSDQFTIVKTSSPLPQPVQCFEASDPQGDDLRNQNYKFSSMFGTGPNHQVNKLFTPPVSSQNLPSNRYVSILAIQEYLSYLTNWATVHSFHYHQKDFFTPEFSQVINHPFFSSSSNSQWTQETTLNYDELSYNLCLSDPVPHRITIDHRYSCDVFPRESIFHMSENGDIIISDGSGSAIIMSGGNIRIEAPGGLHVCTGKETIVLTGQCVIRSYGSVDISSSTEDLRLKAENNLHMLGGNSGQGGVLIESKSVGYLQNYENRIGTEVDGRGIVLKATDSVIANCADQVFIKSTGEGGIILDSQKGKSNINMFCRKFNNYFTDSSNFNFCELSDDLNIKKTYSLSSTCFIPVDTIIDGNVVITSADASFSPVLTVDGNIYVTESLVAGGLVSDIVGDKVSKTPDNFSENIRSSLQVYSEQINDLNDLSVNELNNLNEQFYKSPTVGNPDVLQQIQFSYRDNNDQYRISSQFVWPATLWQNRIHSGLATGGHLWVEPPVFYQNKETYPWPGQKWIEENTFLLYNNYKFFNKDEHIPQNRDVFTINSSELNQPSLTSMSQGYIIIY